MSAVANITEYSNAVTIGNLISRISSPAFVKTPVMMNLMYTEDLPQGTNSKKFEKDGSLTAVSLAESTALPIDSNGELTQGSVTATAAKCAVSSGLSVEAEKFSTLDYEKIGNAQFSAIGRFVDDDALSLFSGLSVSVTSLTYLTIDDLLLGQLNIYESNCPNQEVMLSSVLTPRSLRYLKKEIIESGASVWSNPAMLSIFNGAPVAKNGLIGQIPGVADIYQTTGHATSGSDTVQAIFHPMWTFAGMFDSAPMSWVQRQGAGGLYTEIVSLYFYDVIEWNDLAGVKLHSDTN